MEYSNSKVSDDLLPEGVTQLYQGHIQKSDVVSMAELGRRVASRLKIDAAIPGNVIAALATEIGEALVAGERPVLDGVFSARFNVLGAFDAEDDVWRVGRNQLSVSFVTLDPLKSACAAIVPTNVLGKVTVQLLGAQDATTFEQNTLTLGHTLLCQGKNLVITAAHADEGLYLVKGDTGTAYKATITDNTAGTIDATFPTNTPAGSDYTLEVRGRNGNGVNRSLVTSSISGFTVKAAA